MAFTLALASPPSQSNDAKTLTLQDASTGWVTDQAFPTVGGNQVRIAITIRTPDTTTAYNTLTYNGPYTSIAEMVFDITCADLIDYDEPLGTADDMLPDGLYDVTYTLHNSGGALLATYSTTLVIMGQIKIDIANDFADVPAVWRRKELSLQSDDVLALIQPLQKEAYYEAILSEPFQNRETAILNIIESLTALINDQ